MSKVLKVIKPFFVMETGDTLEYSEENKMYVSQIDVNNSEFGSISFKAIIIKISPNPKLKQLGIQE